MSDLPKGWELIPLTDICQIIQGQSPPGDTYNSERNGLPFFQGKTEFGELYAKPRKWCTEPTKIAERDDILISIRAPVGPTNLCPEQACIGRGLAAIRPLRGVSVKYILYALRVSEQILREKATGTTFEAVSGDDLRNHTVGIAPCPEQERIVSEIEDQFSLLDAAVCALKRVQANLKRYRASVLQAACEGRLVPTEAELARAEERDYEAADKLLERILATRQPDLRAKSEKPDLTDKSERAELPEGWCWTTLGQVFKVYVGATPSRAKPEYWHGEISWVSSGEVAFCRIRDTREKVTELGLRNASTEVHPPGTVLLGMIGEGKTRGQTAILDIPACNNQNCAAIRVSETPVPPNYVYRFLEGQYAKTRKVGGGNNQPALNKRTVSNIDLPLPPIAEQYRIVEELERILSNVDSMEVTVRQSLLRADRLRQSILKKAFEGKLVPQDPNDESASVLLERIRSERNDRKLELKARRVMVKK